MSDLGPYSSTQVSRHLMWNHDVQISDVFYAASHTFDHLTNLALQLNRIDKETDHFDEPCSMETVHESVRQFTQGLESASRLKHA